MAYLTKTQSFEIFSLETRAKRMHTKFNRFPELIIVQKFNKKLPNAGNSVNFMLDCDNNQTMLMLSLNTVTLHWPCYCHRL